MENIKGVKVKIKFLDDVYVTLRRFNINEEGLRTLKEETFAGRVIEMVQDNRICISDNKTGLIQVIIDKL